MTETTEAPKLDPMRVWMYVYRTNPEMTKRVNQRGGFTSINPQYLILQATRLWGPMGGLWNVDVEYEEKVFANRPFVLAFVSLRHPDGVIHKIPSALEPIVSDKGRVDEEAWKKARTNAMSKAFSQLGFAADVFLGKHDDRAYVERIRRQIEKEKAEAAGATASPQSVPVPLTGAPAAEAPAGAA